MKIELPKKVLFIINNLQLHGYEAFAVGGCVRDSILARRPQDWDITTSAKPEEIKKLFRRTIDTGIEHGTVTVLFGKDSFEVTTYRIDGAYEDSRHPKEVQFTNRLEEDLRRRDFTINAMAYNDQVRLVDVFGGMQDLNHHLIRCVGDPEERFSEDALRILRAVRFSAQLNFPIESATADAIRKLAPNLQNISAERIQAELVKLLVSPHPERIRDAYELGLTKVILPEWDAMEGVAQNTPHHKYDVAEHTLRALKNVKRDKILRLTMLFHDIAKPETRSTDENGIDHFYNHNAVGADLAKAALKRLKFDNQTTHMVTTLIANHDIRFNDPLGTGRKHVRKIIHRVGADLFPYLLDVMEADISAQSDFMRLKKLTALKETRQAYHEILAANDCLTLKDLKINGNQLKALGISEGKMIGAILNALLAQVLNNPELNEYEKLEELALKIYQEVQ